VVVFGLLVLVLSGEGPNTGGKLEGGEIVWIWRFESVGEWRRANWCCGFTGVCSTDTQFRSEPAWQAWNEFYYFPANGPPIDREALFVGLASLARAWDPCFGASAARWGSEREARWGKIAR